MEHRSRLVKTISMLLRLSNRMEGSEGRGKSPRRQSLCARVASPPVIKYEPQKPQKLVLDKFRSASEVESLSIVNSSVPVKHCTHNPSSILKPLAKQIYGIPHCL